jgi:hypothetical protein
MRSDSDRHDSWCNTPACNGNGVNGGGTTFYKMRSWIPGHVLGKTERRRKAFTSETVSTYAMDLVALQVGLYAGLPMIPKTPRRKGTTDRTSTRDSNCFHLGTTETGGINSTNGIEEGKLCMRDGARVIHSKRGKIQVCTHGHEKAAGSLAWLSPLRPSAPRFESLHKSRGRGERGV